MGIYTATWYSRDASGNTMATYSSTEIDKTTESRTLTELNIFGSDRLGIFKLNKKLLSLPELDNPLKTHERGLKLYELKNLPITIGIGNVISVVSDRLLSTGPNSNNKVNKFEAEIVRYSDYYPFGFEMAGRADNSESYRYGFNGMEKDNEVIGDANSYTTEFRTIDVRIGRWWSRDPITHEFQSPYCTFDNNPIYYKDPSGADGEPSGDSDEGGNLSNDASFSEVQEKVIEDFSGIDGVKIESNYTTTTNSDGSSSESGTIDIYDKNDNLIGGLKFDNGKWTHSMPIPDVNTNINNPALLVQLEGLPPELIGSKEPSKPEIDSDNSLNNNVANIPNNDTPIIKNEPNQTDDIGVGSGMSLAGAMWENAAKDAVKSVKSGAKGIKVLKNIARGAKWFGIAGSAMSIGVDIYNVSQEASTKNIASLGVNVAATALMFFPPVGTAIGVGLLIIDMNGGTDAIVESIEED